MLIAYILSSVSRLGGGVSSAACRLSQEMCITQGIDVRVVAAEDGFSQEDIEGWTHIRPMTVPVKGPGSFAYSPEMSMQLGILRPDLVHTHGLWMYTSIASLRWAKKAHKPHLVSPHGMLDPWALRKSRWKKKIAGWLYEKAHLNSAACVSALCESEVVSIRKFGLRNPICRIPNGVDLPNCRHNSEPPWHGIIPQGKKVLLYLGRLHKKKGLLNLLLGWELGKKRKVRGMDNWALVIAGWEQGDHGRELRDRILGCNLGDIHLMGPLFGENKEAALEGASAFILPSFSEGLPVAVLEAFAHKLPLIMTPECNVPEGFREKAAIEIHSSPEGIAVGLESLFLMSDMDRMTMGENGSRLVCTQFSWEKIGIEVRSVYEWILGGGPPPSCVITD